MGYTHYTDAEISPKVNKLYQELLKVIHGTDGRTLREIRQSNIDIDKKDFIRDEAMEENFHETAWVEGLQPRLSESFTKTARKSYDIAVALAYTYAAYLSGTRVSHDGDGKNLRMICDGMRARDFEEITIALREYVIDESIDDFNEDDIEEVMGVLQHTLADI